MPDIHEIGKAFQLEGDQMICRDCRRPLQLSKHAEPMRHRSGCSNASLTWDPWHALFDVLAGAMQPNQTPAGAEPSR